MSHFLQLRERARDAYRALPLDFELHVLAQLLVEGAERFVHEDKRRFEHQRAGESDALLLAA